MLVGGLAVRASRGLAGGVLPLLMSNDSIMKLILVAADTYWFGRVFVHAHISALLLSFHKLPERRCRSCLWGRHLFSTFSYLATS